MFRCLQAAFSKKRDQRKVRRSRFRRACLGMEPLESRDLFASMLWIGQGDELSWSNPANWLEVGTTPAVHRVPGTGDDVTIGSGATVQANADVTIRSGTVEAGGSLRILGNLTVSDGLTNAGTMEFGERYDQIMTVNKGTFLNSGTIVYQGGDYEGFIVGKLDNRGTIRATRGYLKINTTGNMSDDPQPVDPAFTFTNKGTIVLSNAAHCYVGGLPKPDDLGTIQGSGFLAIQTVAWDLDDDWTLPTTPVVLVFQKSSVSGIGTLTIPPNDVVGMGAGSTIDVDLVNHGTLIGFTASTINGQLELPADSTLAVGFNALPFPSQYAVNEHLDPPMTMALTVTRGFTNFGKIGLFDASLGSSLHVTNGTLVNAPGGLITSSTGYESLGHGNMLAAQLDNQGTIAVAGSDLTITHGFTNHGMIDMGPTGADWKDLTVTVGTLVNAPGASIRYQGTGIDSGASITAQVENRGTITVSAGQLSVNPNWAPAHDRAWTLTSTGRIHTESDGIFTLGGQFNPNHGTIEGNGGLGFEGADVNLESDWSPTLPTVVAISHTTISGPGKLTNADGHLLAMATSTIGAALENHGKLWATGFRKVADTAPVGSTIDGPLTMAAGSVLLVGSDEEFLDGFALLAEVASDFQPTGGMLIVANGFTNSGEIQLSNLGTESILSVTSGTLVNAGTIRTLGEELSSTLSNHLNARLDNQGTLSVAESNLTVNQQPAGSLFHLTNGSSGTIDVAAGRTLTLGGTGVVNEGTIRLQADAVVDFAVPAVTIDGQGSIQGEPSGTLHVRGSLLGNTQNVLSHSPPGTVWLDGTGTAAEPQRLEVMQVDQGDIDAGYAGNLAYGSLKLGANTYVKLVDQARNSPSTGAEAAYADTLNVPAGATLDRNRLRLYVRQSSGDGWQLHVPSPWHNYANPRDVNGDGLVTPLDALIVINYINANPGSFAVPGSPPSPPRYYDVSAGPAGDGDTEVTALDALIVINFLNAAPAGEADGSGPPSQSHPPDFDCLPLPPPCNVVP